MAKELDKAISEVEPENIIFFDGVCSLCNGFIDFLIKRDSKQVFRFAPLQGHTSNERLPISRFKVQGPDGVSFTSVIYLKDGRLFSQSDAALEILSDLGGLWKLTSVFKLLPKSIRDFVYSFIATHRYQWFGRRETCRVPNKEERKLFLD